MLTIKTSVRPSQIHGNGVFADQRVLAGETVWIYAPAFDQTIDNQKLADAPAAFKDFLEMYAYRSKDMDGALILSCDNARYLNHSTQPNTLELPFRSVASRIIEIGDELTCDYRAFCSDSTDFEETTVAEGNSQAPHDNLYTRIRSCDSGVGVFAIRDIPEGINPFEGDVGNVVRVPVSDVDLIPEDDLRRIYFDFCPVVDNAFIAPRDLNRLTVGWFVNHSFVPNLTAVDGMKFVANRLIKHGEQLTSDYTTYSSHAHRFIERWNHGE